MYEGVAVARVAVVQRMGGWHVKVIDVLVGSAELSGAEGGVSVTPRVL
jgi:hypothetical protein